MPHDGTKKWHFRKNKSFKSEILSCLAISSNPLQILLQTYHGQSQILISYLIIVTFCKCQDHFQKYSVLKSHDPELGYVSYENFWPKSRTTIDGQNTSLIFFKLPMGEGKRPPKLHPWGAFFGSWSFIIFILKKIRSRSI